jgi:hypothetical protein
LHTHATLPCMSRSISKNQISSMPAASFEGLSALQDL